MKPEDAVGLVFALVIMVAVLAIYIGLVVLGVKIAIRKNRSPHWMWFAIHPGGFDYYLDSDGQLAPFEAMPPVREHDAGTCPALRVLWIQL